MEAELMGSVVQLQDFSVHDGDGIRTTIFFAGCPLRCRWCSNPESWDSAANESMSAGEILRQVQRDSLFYGRSGGGVTFSGGEATSQPEFLRMLTRLFYDRSISMWLETCGAFDFGAIEDILMKLDHVFFDLKHMDEEIHRRYTGQGNAQILENCQKLYRGKIPLTLRIPAIPGVNMTPENLEATAGFIVKNVPEAELELLPYHRLGIEKYRALGLGDPCEYEVPEKVQMEVAADFLRMRGVKIVEYR